jgi:hypothetical protein
MAMATNGAGGVVVIEEFRGFDPELLERLRYCEDPDGAEPWESYVRAPHTARTVRQWRQLYAGRVCPLCGEPVYEGWEVDIPELPALCHTGECEEIAQALRYRYRVSSRAIQCDGPRDEWPREDYVRRRQRSRADWKRAMDGVWSRCRHVDRFWVPAEEADPSEGQR